MTSGILLLAKAGDWPAVLRRLEANELRDGELEHDNVTGMSIAHFAAAADRVDVLEKLKCSGVNLRHNLNFCNRTPMEEAKKAKAVNALQWLLDSEYNPGERLFYGDDSFAAMIETFEKHPEKINDPLPSYNSLTWAAICAEELRLRELLWLSLRGADLSATDEMQNTLLHLVDLPAAECFENSDDEELSDNSSEEVEELPLKFRFRGNCEDVPLPTPAEEAELRKIDEVLQEFDLPKDLRPEDLAALKCIAFLASSCQVNLDAVNNDGATAAAYFAERAEINPPVAWLILKILKKFGANLSIKDGDGRDVAMLLASSCGDGAWLQWCVTDGGCDPNSLDEQGRAIEDYVVLGAGLDDEGGL